MFGAKREDQKFCSDACRKEFHRYGGAYMKLRSLVEKTVRSEVRKILAGLIDEVLSLRFSEHGVVDRGEVEEIITEYLARWSVGPAQLDFLKRAHRKARERANQKNGGSA